MNADRDGGQPSEPRRYASPAAARQAVTDRLRAAAADGPWSLSDLQRQYAYDQLVERLYRLDDGWVIKGAAALLARRISVRHTIDIDVYHAGAIADIERRVREAAQADIGDWMTFEVGAPVTVAAVGAQGARVKVRARIGITVWAEFHIDIVGDGIVMTAAPEQVAPLTDLTVTGRDRLQWMAYPLVDHIADKVCAILERHDGRPSTRFKDLVDLVAISARATIGANQQRRALAAEAARRNLNLPVSFDVPDRQLWERGYRAEARRTRGLDAAELDAALAAVSPLVNPLLDGTATGTWDPDSRRWLWRRTRHQ